MKTINELTNLRQMKLILGNGFDLRHGLKSSYKDFFIARSVIYKEILSYVDQNFRSISSLIDKWPNNEYVEYLKERSKLVTLWDFIFIHYSKGFKELFILKEEIKQIEWCDIERAIGDFIKADYKHVLYNYDNSESEWFGPVFLIKLFLKCRGSDINTLDEIRFKNILLSELKRFEKIFGAYLMKVCSNDGYLEFLEDYIKKDFGSNLIAIDSFNYTYIPHQYMLYSQIMNNINGNLHNPIFGISSNNIERKDINYIFTKIDRQLKNININSEYKLHMDGLIIFGHSLNEQDYPYFYTQFDLINLNDPKTAKKIYFVYSVYNGIDENVIYSEYIERIEKLLEAYEVHTNGHFNRDLIENLYFLNKINLVQLPSRF